MTLYVEKRNGIFAIIDGVSETKVEEFKNKERAELFVKSMVGCMEKLPLEFGERGYIPTLIKIDKACMGISKQIATLEDRWEKLPDGSWRLKHL